MAKNFRVFLFLLDVEVSPLSIAKIGLLVTPEVFASIVHCFECKVQNFKIEK